ncbi:MAG TPA: SCP2 sterol-binding domain-containing protein [Burkholderiaceae bacterium]|nr:SCP2 sterol-binding domain-containing protein [Burkholderiaceae bacterium]
MIEQLTTAAAVSVLNRMLARESWARDRLAPFAGRTARFEAPPFALALKVAEGGEFADAQRAEPVVTVGLDLAALPLALGDPQAALRNVSLKGDAEFAQALAFVLQNLRPEPEEELSRFIGDAAAQRIVGLLRLTASHWRQLAERMLDSSAHYLVTENPMLVGRAEVDEFNAAVASLRDDVARLEKRVELHERA